MPFILNTPENTLEMLKTIGLGSIEELYSQIPGKVRLDKPLNLEKGRSEIALRKHLKGLANKNAGLDDFNAFLGAGCYDHYLPAALSAILSFPQFLTAYTPYQAECSQGILQVIYEYQSYICRLTGMDISNASLLDGASGFAEAILMALRISKRKKILVAETVHPEYLDTLRTYLSGFDFTIQELRAGKDGLLDLDFLEENINKDIACCAFRSPNFLGLIEDVKKIAEITKTEGILTVMDTNPLSLAILKEPAVLGVDIICGDGQPLGGSVNFGGSSFGFLAARAGYLRQIPGRIVGKTVDQENKTAYCLTLQAREQHIRREKATSNICSNQSLNAIGAAVYLSLLGEEGLKNVAMQSFSNAQYLYHRLKEVRGIKIPYQPRIFNEFIWEVRNAKELMRSLYKQKIIPGYYVGDCLKSYRNCILSCCTEKKSKNDIDSFVNTLAHILHG